MYTKKDHSKDEYYLTFAMRGLNSDSKICPLTNERIEDGYIKAEGTESYGFDNSNNRKFKCFSLHPIVDGCDILKYAYGSIGYDLNPDSMRVYVGGWRDLRSNNTANSLANNQELLSKKKHGNSYFGNDDIDKVMYKKILNRAKLLKYAIRTSKNKNPQEILQAMFGGSNKSDDDSFRENNYYLEKIKNSNIWKLTGNKVDDDKNEKFHGEHGVNIDGNFELIYDEKNDKIYFTWENELNGVGKDKKGIKVDRIFVKENSYPDYGLENLKQIQQKARRNGEKKNKDVYDNYINKLTDVLIQQFPFGEIRVVKGSIEEGQKNVFLSPEDFINQYFVNENDKNDYLKKLEKRRKEAEEAKCDNKRENVNECLVVKNERQKDSPSKKFKDILNGFNLIKEKLGKGEAKIDPKSGNNKIFLNEKWYDRAHWTEKSIVKRQINKVFDSYVFGKINDEGAKQQLDNIVKRHQRFFNSIYC